MPINRGILTIALGSVKYQELAINLALSLRKWSSLPTAVVVSADNARVSLARFFDYVIVCDDPTVPLGCAAKLHVDRWTPFTETLFVDADCLLYSDGLDDFLAGLTGDFMLPAEYKKSGRWGSARIEGLASLLGVEAFLKTNTGAFYWKAGAESESIFRCARFIFANHKTQLSWKIGLSEASYNDEPILCAALTLAGWVPARYNDDSRLLMVSTIGARDFRSNISSGEVSFLKKGRRESPLICHFCGTKPRKAYEYDANFLRKEAGLTLYITPETSYIDQVKLQLARSARFLRSFLRPSSRGAVIPVHDLISASGMTARRL